MKRAKEKLAWHRVVILVLGILVMVAMAVGSALRPWLRRVRADDLIGAEERTGIATVTARFGSDPNLVGETVKPWAQVRFQGRLYPAHEAVEIDKLKDGDQARIEYRVGKSGRIYVDRVEPLR